MKIKFFSTMIVCALFAVFSTSSYAQLNFYSVGTGGTGGTWYGVWAGASSVVNANSDTVRLDVQATGGSLENVRLLHNKTVSIANTTPDIAYFSYIGEREFNEANKDMRLISTGNYMPGGYVIVMADSDIYSMSDMKGRNLRISVGAPGSGTNVVNTAMLEVLGIEYRARRLAHSEAAEALMEGTIDVFTALSGIPFAAGTELSTRANIRFIPLSDEEGSKVTEAHPYWMVRDLPAGTYDGQDEPVQKLQVSTVTLVNKEMPEDDVYEILNILFNENHNDWVDAHAVAREYTMETFRENIEAGTILVPVHSGAVRFYTEKGISLPDELIVD